VLKTISSRDNPLVKRFATLSRSAPARKRDGMCLLEGEHLAQSYVQRVGPLELVAIRDDGRGGALSAAQMHLVAHAKDAVCVAPPLFDSLSTLMSPSGVLAIATVPASTAPSRSGFVLALDEVQDPGNVGALIRTAAAAGAQQVWLSSGCAFAWSVKTLRAAQGAHFHTQVLEDVDLPSVLRAFAGKRWATLPRDHAAVKVCSLFEAKFGANNVVVLSNEGHGLSPALLPAITDGVSIPMAAGVESLNVAIAGALAMYAVAAQQL